MPTAVRRYQREACEEATRETGFDDFGSDEHLDAFSKLAESICTAVEQGVINPEGAALAREKLVRCLVTRLRLVDYWKAHPELEAEEIRQPIFIIGLPRTGTTVLHGLMHCDPELRSPLNWETFYPVPPSTPETYHSDPRIELRAAESEEFSQSIPGMQGIHKLSATMPDECVMLFDAALASIHLPVFFDLPDYQLWYEGCDKGHSYRVHRQSLQILQSTHPRKRWLLKSPQHLFSIEALFREYPDARVIQTHRHPFTVLASMSSLAYKIQSTVLKTSRQEVGQQQSAVWQRGVDHTLRFRRKHPEFEQQIFDVEFGQFMTDELGMVQRIYEYFDMEPSAEAHARMREYMTQHPRGKDGGHSYSAADFGIDEADIERRFADYIGKFVPPSSAG
ncbi:MAG: sulfotransferase [Deltaproteobacteria bacterium]|nr:sulfotransferase [Deltaproteobacteria bacterium]